MNRPGSHSVTMTIAADATGQEGRFVVKTAANTVAVVTASTQDPLGVIASVAPDGLSVDVCLQGVAQVRVGAAGLTAATDDRLMCDANGRVQPYTADGSNRVIGRMLRSSTNRANLDMIEALIDCAPDAGSAAPGLRTVAMAAGIEAANAIAVTLGIVDAAGAPVSVVTRCFARAYGADMLLGGAAGANFTLTGTGTEAVISSVIGGVTGILFDTDAFGAAEITMTDASGVFAGDAYLQVDVLDDSGGGALASMTSHLALTFA